MTLGFYNDTRTDNDYDLAVLTFSNQVKKQVGRDGLFKGASSEELRDLVVRFECCQSWIEDEVKRVATKRQISGDIDAFCKHHILNKHRLLVQERTGYYLALLASIRFRPDDRDWELILKMKPNKLPPGFAYFKLLEAVEAIKADGKATDRQLEQLHDWLKALPDASKPIEDRINALTK